MDEKGESEEISYPYIYFDIDSYEEDCENLILELTCTDSHGVSRVIFFGSIRYSGLKEAYRTGGRKKENNDWLKGSLNNILNGKNNESKLLHLCASDGKGHAQVSVLPIEMEDSDLIGDPNRLIEDRNSPNQDEELTACSWMKLSQENVGEDRKTHDNLSMHNSYIGNMFGKKNKSQKVSSKAQSASGSPSKQFSVYSPYQRSKKIESIFSNLMGQANHKRRPTDYSARWRSLNDFTYSQDHNMDHAAKMIDSADIDDVESEGSYTFHRTGSEAHQKAYKASWFWFKERRKMTSTTLKIYLTYICIPWYRILDEMCYSQREPILSF